ncbi:MAG: hypothetical protein R6T90_06290, partial [Dissulfuribacterales bacterium]
SPQLDHGGFKGDAGPGGFFVKNQAQGLSRENLVKNPPGIAFFQRLWLMYNLETADSLKA